MTTTDFTTTILVDQTPDEVFNAINNPRGWWQGEINGNTNHLNDKFTYKYQPFHFSKQKVVEMIPGQKVVWLVTDSQLNFVEDKTEWTGTTISFEISKDNDKTRVCFTHMGLVPAFECFDSCSNAWSQLIQQSLFSFITTGKGKNIFD